MNEAQFQQLLEEAPELARFFHYVKGSRRQSGYYRRIPNIYYSREARSKPLLLSEINFGKTAYRSYGRTGFKDGVPIVAAKCGEAQKGKDFKAPKLQRIIDELRASLRAMVVEEEKVVV